MAERRLGGRPDNREGGGEEGNGRRGILVRLIWRDLYPHTYSTVQQRTNTASRLQQQQRQQPEEQCPQGLFHMASALRSVLFRSAKDTRVRGCLWTLLLSQQPQGSPTAHTAAGSVLNLAHHYPPCNIASLAAIQGTGCLSLARRSCGMCLN